MITERVDWWNCVHKWERKSLTVYLKNKCLVSAKDSMSLPLTLVFEELGFGVHAHLVLNTEHRKLMLIHASWECIF